MTHTRCRVSSSEAKWSKIDLFASNNGTESADAKQSMVMQRYYGVTCCHVAACWLTFLWAALGRTKDQRRIGDFFNLWIGSHSRNKSAVWVRGITMGGAALTLTEAIMRSRPSRSSHQLEFRLLNFGSDVLRISSVLALIQSETPIWRLQAEYMCYLYQQADELSGLFP